MILASQSPRRQQLMTEAGLTFRVIPSSFDETAVEAADPVALVSALARAKAAAVDSEAAPGELIVGSDTVVLLGSTILGKPVNHDEARAMLHALSGVTHEVITGVSLRQNGSEVRSFTETAQVTFWDLSDAEIDSYVATNEPMDKAGAYGIQGPGRLMVRSIAGDFYTIVGLPISRLVRELRSLEYV